MTRDRAAMLRDWHAGRTGLTPAPYTALAQRREAKGAAGAMTETFAIHESAGNELQGQSVDALLRARQRGINHLRSLLAAWDEETDDERKCGVMLALDRLADPY